MSLSATTSINHEGGLRRYGRIGSDLGFLPSMARSSPYFRIARPMIDCEPCDYLLDHRYARERVSLCHAYLTLQRDLERVFEFVAPCDGNSETHSHRTFELLLRASTEFETNCKGILLANGYSKSPETMGISDYAKIDKATQLSKYGLILNIWSPQPLRFYPLSSWKESRPLPWYQAYNAAKHNRSAEYQRATLRHVIDAVGSVCAVLVAQFNYHAASVFRPVRMYGLDQAFEDQPCELLSLDGFLFDVMRPAWSEDEQYSFSWPVLKGQPRPFQSFEFD